MKKQTLMIAGMTAMFYLTGCDVKDPQQLSQIESDQVKPNVVPEGFKKIISIAKKGDVVIGISTSGTSENVVNALQVASSLGCITIALSGQNAEKVNKISDITLAIFFDFLR